MHQGVVTSSPLPRELHDGHNTVLAVLASSAISAILSCVVGGCAKPGYKVGGSLVWVRGVGASF